MDPFDIAALGGHWGTAGVQVKISPRGALAGRYEHLAAGRGTAGEADDSHTNCDQVLVTIERLMSESLPTMIGPMPTVNRIVRAAWSAAVVGLVALVAAAGFRWGWWGALVADPADQPWEWVERVGWVAGLLGLPISVVVGLMAARSQPPTDESTDAVPAQGRCWRLVPVATCPPQLMNVQPALPSDDGLAGDAPPSYVARDHDDCLRERLRSAAEGRGQVIVVGHALTGKSRSIYEAILAEFPHWRLLVVDGPTDLREAAHEIPDKTVVLLDDTPVPRFLTPGGMTKSDLIDLLSSRSKAIVVVHVLWPKAYHERSISPSTIGSTSTDDRLRAAREVLLMAQRQVDVAEEFSNDERQRATQVASCTGDERISHGLQNGDGVVRHLGGARLLVEHWKMSEGEREGERAFGWAVLTAAIDARRVGLPHLIGRDYLDVAARGYLHDVARATAPAHWLDDGIKYAERKIRGDIRALIPGSAGAAVGDLAGYAPADYLVEWAQTHPVERTIPVTIWDAAIARISDAEDLAILGKAAEQRGRLRRATHLYRKSVDAGSYSARFPLHCLLRDMGNAAGARGAFPPDRQPGRRILKLPPFAHALSGYAEDLVRHAERLERDGDLLEAIKSYRRLADEGEGRFAVESEVQIREQMGDPAGAERIRVYGLDDDTCTEIGGACSEHGTVVFGSGGVARCNALGCNQRWSYELQDLPCINAPVGRQSTGVEEVRCLGHSRVNQ